MCTSFSVSNKTILLLSFLLRNIAAEESFMIVRQKVSCWLRLLLVVFHSIGITRHASSWYVKKLDDERPGSPLSSLSENLTRTSDLSLDSDESRTLLSAFRDAFAILWMLRVREQVSLHARAYQSLRETGDDCSRAVWECLKWLGRLSPFARFLKCETELQDLVLCLASALPVNFDLARVMANFFPDPTNVDPKVETRFKQMMAKMRQTSVPAGFSATSDRDSRLDRGDRSDDPENLQPMTVVYQQQCRAETRQAVESHVFMKKTMTFRPGTNTSTSSLTLAEASELAQALDWIYPFESDHRYHEFVSQLFEIILEKSASLRKYDFSTRKSARHRHAAEEQVFVLANRFQIATAELERAAENDGGRAQKFASRFGKASFEKPHSSSTPKPSLKKASSLGDVMRSVQHLSFSDSPSDQPSASGLRRYFSKPEVNATEDLSARFFSMPECPVMTIADAPAPMRKRLGRLSMFTRWLHHWADSENPGVGRQRSAIRLKIRNEQLLGGLIVAELRFGKNLSVVKSGASSEIDQSEARTEATLIGPQENDVDEVTTVSSLDVRDVTVLFTE